MFKSLPIFLIFLLLLTSCKSQKEKTPPYIYNPCTSGHDTTLHLDFEKDTTTKDFYQLLDFIEHKGEFSRFDKKHKIDSSIHNSMWLQKLICQEKGFDSPKETWVLYNVFSIRYYMTSNKPVKGEKDYFPKFDITQFNFTTEAQKNKALNKIKEIGWGDPLKKWNDYYIVTSKTRIIVLQSYVAIFSETKNRYGKMLQKEWADKNNY
ncbi:hypothetical protein [Ferruginibacter sp. SUN106]|uniref:hypothetical protein n=1 Tax=Ferruginibacter sp. SUN106 TaxID=2978348 RepID=UPI003D3636C6